MKYNSYIEPFDEFFARKQRTERIQKLTEAITKRVKKQRTRESFYYSEDDFEWLFENQSRQEMSDGRQAYFRQRDGVWVVYHPDGKQEIVGRGKNWTPSNINNRVSKVIQKLKGDDEMSLPNGETIKINKLQFNKNPIKEPLKAAVKKGLDILKKNKTEGDAKENDKKKDLTKEEILQIIIRGKQERHQGAKFSSLKLNMNHLSNESQKIIVNNNLKDKIEKFDFDKVKIDKNIVNDIKNGGNLLNIMKVEDIKKYESSLDGKIFRGRITSDKGHFRVIYDDKQNVLDVFQHKNRNDNDYTEEKIKNWIEKYKKLNN
ncbi:MAG: hypothetical protein FWC41_04450 [Firmicutes bacterium]|nr:hypothetical protein [Bacillota bacterium]